jgi:hypothetical protein
MMQNNCLAVGVCLWTTLPNQSLVLSAWGEMAGISLSLKT